MRCIHLLLVGVVLISISACKDNRRVSGKTEVAANPRSVVDAGGTIQGRVVYKGDSPLRRKLMVVKDVAVCGKSDHYDERLVVSGDGGVKNAVISLTGIKGGKPVGAMGTEFSFDQTGCSYQPHVTLVPVNMPLQILNGDGILHNVHTYSTKNRPMNLSQPKSKKKMMVCFAEPERIQVKCDIHGWMDGWIIVVDHPYHAVTDAEGRFTIADVPPGDYTLTCWQEMLGEQTEAVIVGQEAVTVNFNYDQQAENSR